MKSVIVGLVIIAIGAFLYVMPNEDWRSSLPAHEEMGVGVATVGVLAVFGTVFSFIFRMLYSAFLAILSAACILSVVGMPTSDWTSWNMLVLVVGLALGLASILLFLNRLGRRKPGARPPGDALSSKAARGITSGAMEETLND